MKLLSCCLVAVFSAGCCFADDTAFSYADGLNPTVTRIKKDLKVGKPYTYKLTNLNWIKYTYEPNLSDLATFNATLAEPLTNVISSFKVEAITTKNSSGEFKKSADTLFARLMKASKCLSMLQLQLPRIEKIEAGAFEANADLDTLQGAISSELLWFRAAKNIESVDEINKVLEDYKWDDESLVNLLEQIEKARVSIKAGLLELETAFYNLSAADKTKEIYSKPFESLVKKCPEADKALADAMPIIKSSIAAVLKWNRQLSLARSYESQEFNFIPKNDAVVLSVSRKPSPAYTAWAGREVLTGARRPSVVTVSSPEAHVWGRAAFDTSVGFLATNLRDKKFYKDSSNVIQTSISDASDLGPALFLHFLPKTGNLGFGVGSVGLTLGASKGSTNAAYFGGLSFHLGADSRIILTAGWAYRSSNRLLNGQSVGTNLGANSIAQGSITRSGLGVGVSFKVKL